MKEITLQTAVMLTIAQLSAQGSFSAHDVTMKIRQDVDLDYFVTDADFNYQDDHTVINHDDVRILVNELFENGLFQATKGYKTIAFGKVYVEYTPIESVAPTQVKTSTPISTVVPTPVASSPHLNRINEYLKNRGDAVTIKQIQSALKINGLTCKEIAKNIHYNQLVVANDAISKSVVKYVANL